MEAVCLAEGASGKNLSTKINKLAIAGVVSKKDASSLQAIRFMGNDAAHDIRAAPKEAIVLAFSIVEHILETQYTQHAEQVLELPIEDYDSFLELVKTKLRRSDKNTAFTFRSLLGRDARRVSEYKDFEDRLRRSIQEGGFDLVKEVEVSEPHAEGKAVYKRTEKEIIDDPF